MSQQPRTGSFISAPPVDATLHYIAIGEHPLHTLALSSVDGVGGSHQDPFAGYPKYKALLQLKESAVDEIESRDTGCGPDGKGYGVKWLISSDPWDREKKFVLADLVSRLDPVRLSVPNISSEVTGFQDQRATSRSIADRLMFDSVLISELPNECPTQALLHMPIGEITGWPSFVFLLVPTYAELPFCMEILETWGFQAVEDVVCFEPQAGGSPDANVAQRAGHDSSPKSAPPASLHPGHPLSITNESCWRDLGMSQADFEALNSPPPNVNSLRRDSPGQASRGDGSREEGNPKGGAFQNTARNYLMDPATVTSYVMDLIENFSLGRRRLHVFGSEDHLRRGWVTIGPDIRETTFDAAAWSRGMTEGYLVRQVFLRPAYAQFVGRSLTDPRTGSAVEQLRPRSPSTSASDDPSSIIELDPGKPANITTSLFGPVNSSTITTPNLAGLRHHEAVLKSAIDPVCISHGPSGALADIIDRNNARTGNGTGLVSAMRNFTFFQEPPNNFTRRSGKLLQHLVDDLTPLPSRPSGKVLHRRFGSHGGSSSSLGAVSSMSNEDRITGSVREPPFNVIQASMPTSRPAYYTSSEPRALPAAVEVATMPMHHASRVYPAPNTMPPPRSVGSYHIRPAQQPSSHGLLGGIGHSSRSTVQHSSVRPPTAFSGNQLFNAICALAFQKAVALPEAPPPPNWVPGMRLPLFYEEMARRFSNCFFTTLVERNCYNSAIFEWENNRHLTCIFRSLNATWNQRPFGSMIGLCVDRTLPHSETAALALQKTTAKPDFAPKANWKAGEKLHPYYDSLLNRFELHVRQMLGDRNMAILMNEDEMARFMQAQKEILVYHLRQTWNHGAPR